MTDPLVMESINRYHQAHFSDENGYQPNNHNFAREDVILQMYEYVQVFRKAFLMAGWSNKDISSKKVLEIGSAWGLRLNQLLGFNLRPINLFGIDIQEEYIRQARQLNPFISFEVMSATEINYPDKYFDCSFVCVALQAMMDDTVITQSLSEMCRVSREFILIVDIFDPKYSCQRNGAMYLKGIDLKHIKDLEDVDTVEQVNLIGSFWSTNKLSWLVYRLLNKIGFPTLMSYVFSVVLFPKHSHKAYFVKLRKGKDTE